MMHLILYRYIGEIQIAFDVLGIASRQSVAWPSLSKATGHLSEIENFCSGHLSDSFGGHLSD
jgi:hypothetical protein